MPSCLRAFVPPCLFYPVPSRALYPILHSTAAAPRTVVSCIRVGSGLNFEIPSPTPMLLMLYVHPSRSVDMSEAEIIYSDPPLPLHTFIDAFGNRCARIEAPAGPFATLARHHRPRLRPSRSHRPYRPATGSSQPSSRNSALSHGQSLLRNRPPLGNRLEPLWQHARGLAARAGDLQMGSRQRHVRLRIRPRHQDRLRSLHRPPRRLPGFHAPAHHPPPLHEHPRAICLRLSGRHRRARRPLAPMDFQPPGPKYFWMASGTPSMPATTSRALAASS